MNKVICDICGTDYPETASQCPICGCTQRSAGGTVADGDKPEYTYVKGGRFSKSNVRKRLKGAQVPTTPKKTPEPKKVEQEPEEQESEEEEQGSSVVLIVIVILLLLAIIAVAGYIAVKYFDFSCFSDSKEPTTSFTTAPTTEPTTEPTTQPTLPPVVEIPCTDIVLNSTSLSISELNGTAKLDYKLEPADTTDAVVFTSSDESVATVDENGNITATGKGEAVISIASGGATKRKVKVVCDFEEPMDHAKSYILKIDDRVSRYGDEFNADVSLNVGGKFKLTLEDANGKVQDVEWVISNEECVTLEGTTVTGVAKSPAAGVKISVTIGDQAYVCLVRVK